MENVAGIFVEACVSELCFNLFAGAQLASMLETACRYAQTAGASPLHVAVKLTLMESSKLWLSTR